MNSTQKQTAKRAIAWMLAHPKQVDFNSSRIRQSHVHNVQVGCPAAWLARFNNIRHIRYSGDGFLPDIYSHDYEDLTGWSYTQGVEIVSDQFVDEKYATDPRLADFESWSLFVMDAISKAAAEE